MTIKQIFKYEIYETKLNFDLDSIKKFCFQVYETETGIDKLEMFSGWQSKNIYNEYPIINMLRTEISTHLKKYLKHLKFNASIELDNFWINFHEYKDYTEPHIHPFSIISGVYFVKIPENCGNLIFYHPAEDIMCASIREEYVDNSMSNSPVCVMKPEENQFVLFPSFYKHSVGINKNKQEKRISIAFNANIKKNNYETNT